jgi:RNase P subunit RPR2
MNKAEIVDKLKRINLLCDSCNTPLVVTLILDDAVYVAPCMVCAAKERQQNYDDGFRAGQANNQ